MRRGVPDRAGGFGAGLIRRKTDVVQLLRLKPCQGATLAAQIKPSKQAGAGATERPGKPQGKGAKHGVSFRVLMDQM